MRPRGIEVHIGELVLEGVSPVDRGRVGAAMERELSRLFAERGLPGHIAQDGAPGEIDAGAFARMPSSTPEAIGGGIARTVYGGLGQ